jgi:heptaprenyl diphosphate synthase
MPSISIPDVSPLLEAELEISMERVEALLRSHIEGDYPLVVETSRHLVEAGGKRLRPLLTLITAQFGDPSTRGIIEAAVVCELTHLATLYHDDVMDEAPLRRGVESANNRWGNTIAILTGDYLFAKASDLLADLGTDAVRLQARTFERLVIGQITETQGPHNGDDPLEHYLKVVADKTVQCSLVQVEKLRKRSLSLVKKLVLLFNLPMMSSILQVNPANQVRHRALIFGKECLLL